MDHDFQFRFIEPDQSIADFVENLGTFHNRSDEVKEVVIIPDGRVDLFFMQSSPVPFQVTLIGLETYPEQRLIPPQTKAFVVSFKPIAVEYILHTAIADILNTAQSLPEDFWDFKADDLQDFELCYTKATHKIQELIPQKKMRENISFLSWSMHQKGK